MCSSKSKPQPHQQGLDMTPPSATKAQINGRPALQPACNRIPSLERNQYSFKKITPKSPTTPPLASLPPPTIVKTRPSSNSTPPASPNSKSPRPPALKRGSDPNGLNSSLEKVLTPRGTTKSSSSPKKTKKCSAPGVAPPSSDTTATSLNYSSSDIVEAPGSIAAARREQMANLQVQRKMRIAHYGRTKSAKFEDKIAAPVDPLVITTREEKRCSFITANSDPIYVEYHDQEWGVPVHDDKRLLELLAMTGAQVGSDWTTVLKKRQQYRDAFSGYDAEIVAKFSEKKIVSISAYYGIDLSQVRGVVDNSNRILEIKKELGSFHKYIWGFVNHKPITTQYKSCHKIPVKTSKSESISKDMVRRGFRLVGPTVIHSFMQAAGLTNDHLISCSRHLQCMALASQQPTVAPAL